MGRKAASTKLRPAAKPLAGASAVTTASLSPTAGSVSQTTPVEPAMRASSPEGPAASRRMSTPAGAGASGPKLTVQAAASPSAPTRTSAGASTRNAVKPGPETGWKPRACLRPRGAADRSSRAAASNTIHTASPRRNTAAPKGARQGKRSRRVEPRSSEPMRTAPEAGTGFGRGGGAAGASAGLGGGGETLIQAAPSA